MITLKEALTDDVFGLAEKLFQEYAESLGVDLEFQNFSEELSNIQNQYSRPNGVLILAIEAGFRPMGCFGVRPMEGPICELKRMYLRKQARGKGIGKLMLKKSISMARELGYEKMRLDTLPSMQSAIKRYQSMGFYEIGPYRYNPIEGTKYFEIEVMNQPSD